MIQKVIWQRHGTLAAGPPAANGADARVERYFKGSFENSLPTQEAYILQKSHIKTHMAVTFGLY